MYVQYHAFLYHTTVYHYAPCYTAPHQIMQYYVGLYHTGPSVGSLGLGLGNWLRRRCKGISGVIWEWYVLCHSFYKMQVNYGRSRNILVT